jgi:DNA-binding MarR family transcriptional regulator
VSHPSRRLDDAVHQRTRLGILAVLCEGGRADFAFLRDTLELTDGNLSRNISRLEAAGFVAVEKVIDGSRPRTWLSPTTAGRRALAAEVAALREIIAGLEAPSAVARALGPAGHLPSRGPVTGIPRLGPTPEPT